MDDVSNWTASQILDEALKELANVPFDFEWTLPDLFRGHVWHRTPQSARKAAGMMFKDVMAKQKDVEILPEKNHKQQYRKMDPANTVQIRRRNSAKEKACNSGSQQPEN